MSDPYSVLDVSPSASDDEVTKAYRKMAKKYHPDLNPGDKSAEKKMQEVNAAYEQIKAQKHGGKSYEGPGGQSGQSRGGGYGGYNPYGYGGYEEDDDPFGFSEFFGFGSRRQGQQQSGRGYSSPRMQAVHSYILNRQYHAALRVLSEIAERDGQWYYYSAIANAGTGNRVTALNHAREAVHMEPGNTEYLSLLQQLQRGGFEYRQAGQGFGFNMARGGGIMSQVCLSYLVCNCCCRYGCI